MCGPRERATEAYIDRRELLDHPSRHALVMLVHRTYKRCAENLDLVGEVAWVRFRQALQGIE